LDNKERVQWSRIDGTAGGVVGDKKAVAGNNCSARAQHSRPHRLEQVGTGIGKLVDIFDGGLVNSDISHDSLPLHGHPSSQGKIKQRGNLLVVWSRRSAG